MRGFSARSYAIPIFMGGRIVRRASRAPDQMTEHRRCDLLRRASLLFLAIARAAIWPPSRRAMRVDPVVPLRYQ
jgi:hypothetical protein